MEREVKEGRESEARVLQVIPQINFVPDLSQERSIYQNMHYNSLSDSERRRRWLSRPDHMSCTELLALASSIGTSSSIPSYGPYSQMSVESNPWIFNSGTKTDISQNITLETPQYNASSSQKLIFDLNLTPEEIVSSSLQPTNPDFSPITLDTPGKRLSETHKDPDTYEKVYVRKNIREKKALDGFSSDIGSPVGEKQRKRARDADEKSQLKTPQQIQKRKKIRPKVVREGNTKRSTVKKASAPTPSVKTPEANSYVHPKRTRRRSLRFDYDVQEEDRYCGFTLSLEDYIDFDNIPKRRRQNRTRSQEKTLEDDDPKGGNYSISFTPSVPSTFMEGDLPIDSHISQTRKRSCIFTRPRNFQSLKRILQGIKPIRKGYGTPQRPQELKAIVSKIHSNVPRKKRGNRDPIASQLNSRVLQMQWRSQNSTGTSAAEIWEQRFTTNTITKLFEQLDINKESSCLLQNRETALILHQKTYQELKAVVQYKRDGSIIPYTNEKKFQPKVKLDDETTRMWKLLMVSMESEGVDGSDKDKQKWWEEEREVLRRRADLFVARMRLVQGDRSFSPWKGSVVDSVVGVFLTQNVADHSSSSAFMDIAAEFPVNFNKELSLEDLGSSVTTEPVMKLDTGIRNPTCIIDEIDDDEDDNTGALFSQESYKSSDSSINSTSQSKTVLLDPPANSFKTNFPQEISMVSSTSTCYVFNLNEVPLEVENCDEFGNQVQDICSPQVKSSTLQTPHQESKTRINKNINSDKKNRKKQARPANNKSKESFDWDSLKKKAKIDGQKGERSERTMDSVNWEALRCTDVNKIADIIRKRGMNYMLSERIKAFLDRLVKDHEEIDLEWLRDVPPDKVKEYLLSINGLGLKSVECVRLLSLHQVAFPVDTNVGRIAVRLGWVPLQPLPDELQMHLLELYPVLESVQKYLWPRLCKLDQKTLYELHYHMITFGKVFCTKVKPNCKACPMKAECRHYASASASARLALPEPEESTSVTVHKRRDSPKPVVVNFQQSVLLSLDKEQEEQRSQNCEPIIEEPASPEPECAIHDIEDYPWDNNDKKSTIMEAGTSEDPWENVEIPTIMIQKEAGTSKDLVVLSTRATSMPTHKLKVTEKLRTEHYVYELPDNHPILEGFEKREIEDKSPYLLAIWTPGETANSIHPPKRGCLDQENNTMCCEETCFSCNNIREETSEIVRGTILIPCRTAMRGSFPLNGTYFQTNEVFADHGSSMNPIDVPRQWIWNLPRRIVYFGSSVTACFGGLEVEAIQYGFWRGYICVRGFDRKKRTSQTLVKRLHCPPGKKKQEDNE